MKHIVICTIAGLFQLPVAAQADSVLAARTIRSQTILLASDIMLEENDRPSAFNKISDVIGLETRVILYEGRRISSNDVGPAAIVRRNQVIKLVFLQGNLNIAVEGRSLGRAGVGEMVRVMNLSSRNTVTGTVAENGTVFVNATNTFASN